MEEKSKGKEKFNAFVLNYLKKNEKTIHESSSMYFEYCFRLLPFLKDAVKKFSKLTDFQKEAIVTGLDKNKKRMWHVFFNAGKRRNG